MPLFHTLQLFSEVLDWVRTLLCGSRRVHYHDLLQRADCTPGHAVTQQQNKGQDFKRRQSDEAAQLSQVHDGKLSQGAVQAHSVAGLAGRGVGAAYATLPMLPLILQAPNTLHSQTSYRPRPPCSRTEIQGARFHQNVRHMVIRHGLHVGSMVAPPRP